MKALGRTLLAASLSILGLFAGAQNDGDHSITDPFGLSYLAPDAQVPIGGPAVAPANFTIGLLPTGGTLFSVRANQFPGNSAQQDNIFSTRGDAGRQSIWSMWRDTDPIGRLFCNQAAANRGFNIQLLQRGGSLNLRTLNGKPSNTNVVSASGFSLVDDTVAYAGYTWNGYPDLPRVGYARLGHTDNGDVYGFPWSRFHLVHGLGAQTVGGNYVTTTQDVRGFRGWMRNGISLTGTGTWGYLGQKYLYSGLAEVPDSTDMIAAWGDSTIAVGATKFDNFSFRFTSDPTVGSAGSSSTTEGLEVMRLRPYRATTGAPIQGLVGIGDWVNNAPALPSERLDLLNGRLRIRQLPNDPQADDSIKVLVIDTAAGPDFGVVKWKYASSLVGNSGSDCDWDIGPGTNLTTAWNSGAVPGCPTDQWKVGIGTPTPTWKLHVEHNGVSTPGLGGGIYTGVIAPGNGGYAQGMRASVAQPVGALNSYGVAVRGDYFNPAVAGHGVHGILKVDRSEVAALRGTGVEGATSIVAGDLFEAVGVYGQVGSVGGTATKAIGVQARTVSPDMEFSHAYGVWARAEGALNHSYGVYGEAADSLFGERKIGVAGIAGGPYDQTNGSRIGVYGEAYPDSVLSFAGYFRGDVGASGTINSPVFLPWSDETLKENETPIADAAAVLGQVEAITYTFATNNYPDLGLPGGLQSGVLAQNIQTVLPHLVHTVSVPARYDSAGVITAPPHQFMAVNYDGLIPYLIAGYKEQQARLDQQDQQLAAMQQALDACCIGGGTDGGRFQDQGNNTGTGIQDLSRMAGEDLLTIAPNPFEERTTISYRAAAPGRVMLRVSDGRGQHIDTLRDAMQDAGAYTYEWHTVNLAPGMYTVSLLLDGQLLVERAVKVQ